MIEVAVEQSFAAAHRLRGYKGKCENLHGHNYKVRVRVAGETLDSTGLLVDFTLVKRLLREAMEKLDHKYLNEVPPFDEINPSAENIARFLFEEIQPGLPEVARLAEVRVWETDTAWASYRPAAREN